MYKPDIDRDKGIALLDERGPKNWRKQIDLETLDMDHEGRCILGQLYGGYEAGLSALDLAEEADIVGFGFLVPGNSQDEVYAQTLLLNASWKEGLLINA